MNESAGNDGTTTVDWYFDLVSPFAFLQLNALDRLPRG